MHDYRIDDVGLSIKAVKFLKRNHIDYVSDLLELKNDDIYQFPGAVSQNVEEMIHLRNSFLTELGSDTLEPVDRAVIDNRNAVIYQIIPELRYMESFSLTYMTDDGEEVDDCSLAEAGFSYRMVHYLTRQGISTVMDFVKMDLTKLVCTRNIGKKSIQESFERLRPRIKYELGKREKEIRIIKKIWGYLKKEDILSPDGLDKALEEAVKNTFEKACELTDDAIEKLPDNSTIMTQIMTSQPLLLWLENYLESIIQAYNGISKKRLEQEVPSLLVSYGTFDAALNELVKQLKIEVIDDRYRWRLPYLSEWIDSLKDNERKALTLKLQNKTLRECGEVLGVSRERVHQIIQSTLKKKPVLREDEYGYWFRTYDLSEDCCAFVFDMDPFAYAYLNMTREKGLTSAKDMLQDPNMNGILYSRINQYLHKNLVFIEDEYVEKDRKQIVLKLAKTHYSQQDGSFSELYEEYMDFLKARGLAEIEELKFVSEMAFESSVHKYPDILYKCGKRFRYYPVDEYDINDFIDRLNLTKYQNMEISTKKIMLDCPELMEEFDIHDEYELHNLLKKTVKKWNTDAKQQISLQRMPLISFGHVDREKQIEDLLYQIAPVTKEAFGRYYEKTYGVLSRTFFANMSQCINKYNHNGIYDVELPLFDKSEEAYMAQSLTDDFYFIEDVKNIYTEKFGLESVKKVNARIMDELGYKLYSQYAIKKNYPSADNYFQHFILKNHFFDLNQIDSRFIYIPNFYTVFDHLKTEFKILEYGDKQFIRYDLFQKVLPDVGAQDFLDFIDKAIKASGTQPFFTFHSLKNEGFEDPFEILGTGEWFSTALIRNSKKIRFKKIGGTTLFYKGSAKQTTVDFIRYIMKDIISIGTTELIEYLKEKFGIKLDKEKMKQFIKKSDMYYDQYTMKLYITEDAYYEEIYG